ncbi:FAD-dependent oxidoreductase [Ectothiorhodospira haloalkaliphila]|uniref:NAD(P)/FAD-dependent oxidoreductase n=1 Tax=Ectothiorhodospira haloalkaliphila TaxID=421628 RepID=UPI001EE8E53F|nr:FAD-dependent oxidoreductase [Ectothiorhodospira haloalkaliphila]MCG5523814.1 FAD-dependent oxidoreductase [Ectothiorhodospira haloalkaliphila]
MAGTLILGTGLAGYNVARELRKHDTSTPLTLITQDDGEYYTKPMLSNALTQGKTAESLVQQSAQDMARELDADIRARTTVASLDTRARKLCLESGESLEFDSLVLAVGASPIEFSYEGDGAGDIMTVNSLADYARFRRTLEGVDRVALIGPGLIGCEFANDISGSGRQVEVIGPDAYPLGRLVPEAAGRALQRGLEQSGITFHLETVVTRVDREGDGYCLHLKNGDRIRAGAVLSAIGLRPRTALAEAAGLEVNRGIVVDRHLTTSAEGIHALGDCAEVEGQVLPYVMPIMQAAPALGRTLAGEPTAVSYPAMPVRVKIPSHPVVVSPVSPDARGQWSVEEVGEGVKALFHDEQGKLLGFALTGREATREHQALTRQLPSIL